MPRTNLCPQIHTACKPHQFALSTRAEAIVHALTAAAESNPTHTILSADGIGAYDTISRASMLQGLLAVPEANCCLPFVRQFYTAPSTYIWHDSAGQPHSIVQAKGGEQGDKTQHGAPPEPYAALHPSLSEFQPDQPVDLPEREKSPQRSCAWPVQPHRRYPSHPDR